MFARVSKWWHEHRGGFADGNFTIGAPGWDRMPETQASREVLQHALPHLRHVTETQPTEWVRQAFGERFNFNVASMVPAGFEAYVEIYNPLVDNRGTGRPSLSWRAAMQQLNIHNREAFLAQGFFKQDLMPDRHCDSGTVARELIQPLIERLREATSTPNECYFAVWHGFGGTVVPRNIRETLQLPVREYHVFAGTIDDAITNYDQEDFTHQSANLWWPADRAWFLSMDVDFHWSYVGGTRALIQSLLADPRLEAVEVAADYSWNRR